MAFEPIVSLVWSLAAAAFAYFFYTFYRRRTWYRGLPQPPHNFFMGHLIEMGKIASTLPPNCHPQAMFTELGRKYNLGDIFYVDMWPAGPVFVVLGDANLCKQMQVLKPHPIHPIVKTVLDPVLGEGSVAAINGPLWKQVHNVMSPAFAWQHLRSLVPMIVDECQTFRTTLNKLAATGDVFSFEKTSGELVFDVISRTIFNYSLQAQTGGCEVLKDMRAMIDLTEASISPNPFTKFRAWLKRDRIKRKVNSFIVKQIDERFRLLQGKKVVPSRRNPYSLLDLMLREHIQAEQEGTKSSIFSQEMALLVPNVSGLLLGGHGTTTDTLCFTYMLLSKNPEALRKLREEHAIIFAVSHEETIAMLVESPQKLSELEYTGAVINETLRLFPVGSTPRAANHQDETLTHEGISYPIGNDAAIQSHGQGIHYDERYFPEPTEFRPERFLDPDTASVSRANMFALGKGSRACMGQNLAQDELKVILVMTARDFDFECAGLKPSKTARMTYTDLDLIYGDIIFQELGIEAKPRGGMMMTVSKAK